MKNINWKKFVLGFIVLLPFFLALDVLLDVIQKKLDWAEIWALKNMFFKVAAALVGAYYYSTYNKQEKE